VLAELGIAAASGLVASTVVFLLYARLLMGLQSSSEVRSGEIVGKTAEVTTPIEAGKLGEVSFVARGARVHGPARSADGGLSRAGRASRFWKRAATSSSSAPSHLATRIGRRRTVRAGPHPQGGVTQWRQLFSGRLAVVGILFVIFILLALAASRYKKVGPNQVLVISGRKHTITDPTTGEKERVGFRIVKGGGAVIWPVVERVDVLSLEIMTIDLQTPEVYTEQGVPVTVDGVAQIKIKGDEISIRTAAEQFLSKTANEIKNVAHETLAGHLRAILGTMTVEEIYKNRDAFAQRVQEVSAVDMAHMGLDIVSLTIKEIRDDQGYLDALGRRARPRSSAMPPLARPWPRGMPRSGRPRPASRGRRPSSRPRRRSRRPTRTTRCRSRPTRWRSTASGPSRAGLHAAAEYRQPAGQERRGPDRGRR